MSYSTGTIKIPVLFDMSGDTIVYGEEASGDFVSSHLDFLLDMTTEANGISLNAADISGAILVGDQDTGDNIFYSGGSSGNIAVDNLCNRIAKAITRGKLVHIPKTGDHSNSGIPMGGRANLTNNLGELGSSYAIKYLTSVAPIGDEQMLGQAMARVASIHLVGSPLPAGIFEDQNQIQTDLETASAQTFNSGNTAFYNALAVQLSKVLGGSKSSAPMNNGSYTVPSGNAPANTSTEYNLTAIYDTHLQTLIYSSSDYSISSHFCHNGEYLSGKINNTYTQLYGYNATTGAYEGAAAPYFYTTTVDGNNINGAWFQVDCGQDVWVNRWEISPSDVGDASTAKDSIIAYSLDGSTWSELVDTSTTDNTTTNLVLSGTLPAKVKGRYFRWILKTTNGASIARVRFFNLWGQTDNHHTDTTLTYGTTAPQQIGYVHFNDENASLPTSSPAIYITGHDGTGKALSTMHQTHADLANLNTASYIQTTSDVLPTGAKAMSFWCNMNGNAGLQTQLLFRMSLGAGGQGNAMTFMWDDGKPILGCPGVIPVLFVDGRRFYFESSGTQLDQADSGYKRGSRPWPWRAAGWHHFYISWAQGLYTGHPHYKDLSNYTPTKIQWMGQDTVESNFTSAYNCPCAIDDIRFFSAPLTPIQIHDYYIGNDGSQNGNALPIPYIVSNYLSYPTLTRTLSQSSGSTTLEKLTPTLWGSGFKSDNNKYNSTTGEYTASETTDGYAGEWFQIDFGEVITGVYAQISPVWSMTINGPNTFRLLSSLDGTNWTTWFDVVDYDGASWSLPGRTITLMGIWSSTRNAVEMRYLRLVVNKLSPSSGKRAYSLLNVFGYNAFDKADAAASALNAIPPNDASGTSVPALKSIYEQLMNVPGRSQIMETRDITNVPMPSGTTNAGGFPFISGDKLVMFLRPKIVFAAQTKAEQNTSLVTAGGPTTTTIDVPVYDIGRKSSAGGAISGQIYTNSSSHNDDDTWGFHKCFEGDHTDDEEWTTAGGADHVFATTSPFDYTGNQNTTNIDGSSELLGEWGQVDIGQDTVINKFQIWPRPSRRTTRSPSDFSLLGSLDGTNWTTIKAVSGLVANDWATTNGNTPAGTITWELGSVHGPYRYYRISVQSAVGSGDGRLSLTGLLLYGAKSPSEVTTGSTGSVSDISGIETNIVATAENIEGAFPGNATIGPEPEINKWGWMGSATSDSLSLETTDVTDVRTCDLHIWKITITL